MLVEDTLLQPRSGRCAAAAMTRSMASCSISAFRRCSSTRPERGFSFRLDGPLDMRMGDDGPSAADVVARASERDLAAIIATLGEERHARAVARAIVARARRAPIAHHARARRYRRARRARAAGRHPSGHPHVPGAAHLRQRRARRAGRGLAAAERVLKPGGRLVVVAFHSLEDRIVKTFSPSAAGVRAGSRHLPQTSRQLPPTFALLTKRPVTPDEAEVAANPRARSAKLRAAERTDAAPRTRRSAALLPRLPVARRRRSGRSDDASSQHLRDRRARARGGRCLQDQVRVDACRPSASPSCAVRSGASATPSRRCAPNGPSSTIRRASRTGAAPSGAEAGRSRSNSTRSTTCRSARPIWCRSRQPIRSAP